MKFVTVRYQEEELPGVLTEEETGVYFLKDLLGEKAPDTLLAFIQKEEEALIEKIRREISEPKSVPVSLEQCQLLAPIPKPIRNVICLGMNYQDHVKELKGADGKARPIPKVPVYFGKMTTEIIGPEGIIECHDEITDSLDYEVELVAVIGKGGRNIPPEKAYQHIFGYTIMNDITARDLQGRHQQFVRGKSLDTFTAMGPAILYRDSVKEPVELNLSCEVNGELRQNSNTKNFIFDLPYVISDFSKGTTLQPGDMIATGTPGGVGKGFNPPKYLKRGDRVVLKIDSIGTLANSVEK